MKVLFVSQALARAAYRSKLEHLSRYADVAAVVPTSYEKGTSPTPYRLIPRPLLPLGHLHVKWFWGLGKIVRHEQPDLLHVEEEPYGLLGWQAARIATRLRIPYVFCTTQNIFKTYPQPFRFMERFIHRTAVGATTLNEEAAQILREKGFVKPILVRPQWGVDHRFFHPAALGCGKRTELGLEKTFVIGYMGRLVPEKGLEDLLEAFQGMPEGAALLVVGGGPLAARMESLAKANGSSGHRVLYEPAVPSLKVSTWLSCMDVLVLPSRTRPNWKEQFGCVLAEAMACGLPVIGSSSGEIPRVIKEGGMIFEEGNARALRGALKDLMADPEKRRALGLRGREQVLADGTSERVAEATWNFYRTVCP